MGNQSLSLCRCLLPFGNSATSGMALAEARDLNFKIDRACRSRDLFERTSHSRARARRSCGNHSIRRFMDRTVCILRFSKWQANPYPVVFLESFNAIPYTHGTRSLSGSRILSFPEWLKEHEILESGVSVSCNLCSRASSQSALAQPALFTKISTTTAENKVGTHWGILFSCQDHTKGAQPRKRGGDAPNGADSPLSRATYCWGLVPFFLPAVPIRALISVRPSSVSSRTLANKVGLSVEKY